MPSPTEVTVDPTQSKQDIIKDLQLKLARLQRIMLHTDLSLLVLIDGWESSGKGHLMRHIVKQLDPRYYEVRVIDPPNCDESNNVLLWRFWKQIPKHGRISVLTRSWYSELLNAPTWSKKKQAGHMEAFEQLEQTLINDNMVIVKFFLQQSQSEMKKNIKKLCEDQNRRFLVTKRDRRQLKHYEQHNKHFKRILKENKKHGYAWSILKSTNRKPDSITALKTIVEKLEKELAKTTQEAMPEPKNIYGNGPVSCLDLDKSLAKDQYKKQVDGLQKEAGNLLYEMYTKQQAAVIVFEGTDAAGKGGAIRRLVAEMDPRGFDVATTAAPDATEEQYHYLWRFMRDMPQDGMMTLFDRSWYGRVLVERIEKLTPVKRWSQAYEEILAFEHHLLDQGRLLLKFLIVIDKDEQKIRFEARAKDPDKAHKLTDEDWRNHEKFALYEMAMNEMVERTSTKEAPWILISGTDKRYARIEVLKHFIDQAKACLKDKDR